MTPEKINEAFDAWFLKSHGYKPEQLVIPESIDPLRKAWQACAEWMLSQQNEELIRLQGKSGSCIECERMAKEIAELRAALDESIRVIQFYENYSVIGDGDDFLKTKGETRFVCDLPTNKIAREFLSKHKELIKGEV
jgi:hypothetical protein